MSPLAMGLNKFMIDTSAIFCT